MNDQEEQLRRLKNTIMGVSQRLAVIAGSGELSEPDAEALRNLAAELAAGAQRLARVRFPPAS